MSVQHRTLYIDSRDRDFTTHPTPTSYVVTLPRTYYNVAEARMLHMEIPNSFFIFSAAYGNTTLRVRLGGVEHDVQIPDGNYNETSMPETLVYALELSFSGQTFAATVSSTTLQLTVDCTSSPSALLEIDTTQHADKPTDWGLGYYLGFQAGQVTSGTGLVTSPGVVSLNPWTYMLMDVNELNTSDEVGTLGTFYRIPLDSNSFGYSYHASLPHSPPVAMSPPVHRLRRLTVSFRFHDGTPVNFQGVEHSFALSLGCLPRTSPESGLRAVDDELFRTAALAVTRAMAGRAVEDRHQLAATETTEPEPRGSMKPKVATVVAALMVAGGVWWVMRRRGVEAVAHAVY